MNQAEYDKRLAHVMDADDVGFYWFDSATGKPAPRSQMTMQQLCQPRFFVTIPSQQEGSPARFALAFNEQQILNCTVNHTDCKVFDLEREDFATPLPYRLRVEFL